MPKKGKNAKAPKKNNKDVKQEEVITEIDA